MNLERLQELIDLAEPPLEDALEAAESLLSNEIGAARVDNVRGPVLRDARRRLDSMIDDLYTMRGRIARLRRRCGE